MNAARLYLTKVRDLLDQLERTQMETIERAGALCAEALLAGHHLFVSAAGTHSIHTEITHRAGGFIDPRILDVENAGEMRPGDVLIIGTNAGFDQSTISLARQSRERGITVIAITIVTFEQAVPSQDPSGMHLHQVVDLCIDQGGVAGDALLPFPALDVPIVPGSGVLSVTSVWMIFAAAAEVMIAAGKPPLVYKAIQIPGAIARNERYEAEAARTGVGYSREPDTIEVQL